MGVVEGVGAARSAHGGDRVPVRPGALAWLLAIPAGLLAIGLVALLGPPLGGLLRSGESGAYTSGAT